MDKHKKIMFLLCAGLLAAVFCYISTGLRMHRMIADIEKYAAEYTEIRILEAEK